MPIGRRSRQQQPYAMPPCRASHQLSLSLSAFCAAIALCFLSATPLRRRHYDTPRRLRQPRHRLSPRHFDFTPLPHSQLIFHAFYAPPDCFRAEGNISSCVDFAMLFIDIIFIPRGQIQTCCAGHITDIQLLEL